MRAAAGHVDLDAAFLFEKLDGILRKQTAIPFRAAVARVGAAFGGEIAGGAVGAVSDRLHEFVVELDGFLAGEAGPFLEERILQAHDAEADRAGGACWRAWPLRSGRS